MKTFNDFKNSLVEKTTKIDGIKVDIKKVGRKFQVKIDGDVLDTYDNEKEAMKMAKEFIKQFRS